MVPFMDAERKLGEDDGYPVLLRLVRGRVLTRVFQKLF